jgi:hypothetical protein
MDKPKEDILSEYTLGMPHEQREELQERVGNMNAEELETFRCSFDPDSMGFFGEEGV